MKYLGLLGAIGAAVLTDISGRTGCGLGGRFLQGQAGQGQGHRRPGTRPPHPVQAAPPTMRRVTWLKKPEVHWEPHFSRQPSR